MDVRQGRLDSEAQQDRTCKFFNRTFQSYFGNKKQTKECRNIFFETQVTRKLFQNLSNDNCLMGKVKVQAKLLCVLLNRCKLCIKAEADDVTSMTCTEFIDVRLFINSYFVLALKSSDKNCEIMIFFHNSK